MKYSKLLIMLFLFPFIVQAKEVGVYMECPENIPIGENFSCQVKGYADYEVSAIEYKYAIDNFTQVSFEVDDIWLGDVFNQTAYLYTGENKIGEFNIGKITLKTDIKDVKPELKTLKLSFFDKEFAEHLISEDNAQNNVNNTESESKVIRKKNNKFWLYGIIIIVIVGIILGCILTIRRLKK